MRIAENVYAVMDLYHPIGVNAGFIVTKNHIVYVDSGHTIPSAQTIDRINGVKAFEMSDYRMVSDPYIGLLRKEYEKRGCHE